MITLPKLAVSDTDLTASGLTAKADNGAQDFLALLTGALSGPAATTKDGNPALSLADLREASRQLPQGDIKNTLNQLLAQQSADGSQQVDLTAPGDAQTLLSQLPVGVKGDVVKQLNKMAAKEDDTPTLSNEELAGLSALMAMLPHAATAATAPAAMTPGTANAIQTASAAGLASSAITTAPLGQPGDEKTLPFAHVGADKGQTATPGATLEATTPLVAAAAAKADSDSRLSPAAPAMTPTPVISNATASINTHPVVTVNAQLGTPEWQQNVSQHITLFTRQGQQTAELKLHPEHLGQVNITLKLDDNQAQLQMVSPHSHVRAALEAALPVLRTQLADNGIQLTQSNISGDGFAGQQQQSSAFGQQPSHRSAEGSAFNADDEEVLNVPASLQSAARGNGVVDIFA
ncbi:flagellar hook-length control protein FliK [Pluralibacter sp.]|uniref:flagellar hook-length control protein FliK n=1 Tax=Pluralibacter sp. TaxID=1920032 RepID=UPI0026015978|nr:flagellar hook-length control protein FliK [Pluralibacter sp.]MBV8041600.1 flagellar hook-length control protein FliK [Pluralibacter sp.]